MQSHNTISYELLENKTRKNSLDFTVKEFIYADTKILIFIDTLWLFVYEFSSRKITPIKKGVGAAKVIDKNELLILLTNQNEQPYYKFHIVELPNLKISPIEFQELNYDTQYIGKLGEELFFATRDGRWNVQAYHPQTKLKRLVTNIDYFTDAKILANGYLYCHNNELINPSIQVKTLDNRIRKFLYLDVVNSKAIYGINYSEINNALVLHSITQLSTILNIFSLDDFSQIKSIRVPGYISDIQLLPDERTLVGKINPDSHFPHRHNNREENLIFIDTLSQNISMIYLGKRVIGIVPLEDGSILVVHPNEVQQIFLKHMQNLFVGFNDLCNSIPELIPDLVKIVFDYAQAGFYNSFTPNHLTFFKPAEHNQPDAEQSLFSRCTIS